MLSYVSVQPTEASGFGDTLVSRLCGDQQREGGPGRCRWRLLDERTWGSHPVSRETAALCLIQGHLPSSPAVRVAPAAGPGTAGGDRVQMELRPPLPEGARGQTPPAQVGALQIA